MTRYILKRLIQSIFVILGVTLFVFIILNLTGDPVELMMPPSAPLDQVEIYRENMGFNDPLPVQYFRFIKEALKGDFGTSYYYNEPALNLVLDRFPATLELTFVAFLIAVIWGVTAGVLSSFFKDTKIDVFIRITALLGQCIPVFWLGLMLIMLFSVKLNLLPTSGRGTFSNLLMPAFCLGIFTSSTITRLLRSAMIEVLGQDYIIVAKSKGLNNKIVIMKHAFKNALSSVLTVLGLQIAALMGGAVITETIFSWPGIGRLAVTSIYNRDFMVVEAIVILMAVSFVLVNLIVDLCYSLINPKIRVK